MLLAAILMGGAMALLNARFQPYVTGTNLERWGALITLVVTGMLVYAVATFATGAFRLGDIKRLVRRNS